MIKLGMIGAGGYAFELIKRIWLIPDKIEIVGVSSSPTRKSSGKAACIEKGIQVFDTPEELLNKLRGKADVIFVPTPINTHFALTKACIDSGFDVYLEKPPLATVQELDKLNDYVKKSGKRVAVAFQYLYSIILNELKNRIVSGEFGKVKRVCSMAGWPRMDSYYGRSGWAGKLKENGEWVLDGTINNPLAHMLSNEMYLASMKPGKMAEPISVQAELYHGHEIESEDTSSLRIVTDDNVEILFNATLCSDTEMNPETVIECEKAVIRYKNFVLAEIKYNDGRSDMVEDKTEQRVHMLSRLAECIESGEEFNATLETCRPFTVAVNGAFDCCPQPLAIPAKYVRRTPQGESVKTVIEGIDDALKRTNAEGKLFSEINAPWATPAKKIDVRGYKFFPGNK